MPRIKALAQNYIEPDLSIFIFSTMKKHKLTQTRVAEELKMSKQAVGVKVRTGRLTVKELAIILHLANADAEDCEKLQQIINY